MSQAEVEQFLELAGDRGWKKIEWIDDTSANIIYQDDHRAGQALDALTAEYDRTLPRTDLRRAINHPSRAEAVLEVRLAKVADRKERGAAERSRYYLLHPEADPGNRLDRRYQKRRYNDRRSDRKHEEAPKPFDVNMYDDPPADSEKEPTQMSRRRSYSNASSEYGQQRKRSRYHEEDLFANRDNGRLRDRSRSPTRDIDGDGRYGFADDQPTRRTARHRSRTPPLRRRTTDREESNTGRELFPEKAASRVDTPLTSTNTGVELFPDHASKRNRELFPNKTPHSNHRRSDAMDNDESAHIRYTRKSSLFS